MALTHLRYPWKLEDAAKLRYESYVKAHMKGIGESLIHAVKEEDAKSPPRGPGCLLLLQRALF